MQKRRGGGGGGVRPGDGCQGGYGLRIFYCENAKKGGAAGLMSGWI